jgi:hypothetical protein
MPEVYAYEASYDNEIAGSFILMEFVPGDTAMDYFGGYSVHRVESRQQFKAKFQAAMADIHIHLGQGPF